MQELFQRSPAEHARLEAVFDASTDAMVALADDASVRFLNPAAARSGAFAGYALGRPFIEIVRDYELDALVRRDRGDRRRRQTSVVTFGAARTPLRAAAVPIRDGGEWGVLLLLTDLTEVTARRARYGATS